MPDTPSLQQFLAKRQRRRLKPGQADGMLLGIARCGRLVCASDLAIALDMKREDAGTIMALCAEFGFLEVVRERPNISGKHTKLYQLTTAGQAYVRGLSEPALEIPEAKYALPPIYTLWSYIKRYPTDVHTVTALAKTLDIAPSRLESQLQGLRLRGVIERQGEGYLLTAAGSALDPDEPLPALPDVLNKNKRRRQTRKRTASRHSRSI